MKKTMKLSALASVMAVGFSANVAAETANDTINVYAGLAPVLELTCTDVHFGVWRVPAATRSAAATVTLTATNATVSPGLGNPFASTHSVTNDTDVALSTQFDAPSVGTCEVSGSAASETTVGSATFVGEATTPTDIDGVMLPISDENDYPSVYKSAGIDVGIPTNFPGDGLAFSLDLTTPIGIDTNGNSWFAVQGELTIPATIAATNYGGYKTQTPIEITFDDAP